MAQNFYTSPDTRNYSLPTGILYFKPDADTAYRDLGAVSQHTVTLNTTKLEHKIARGGVRGTDFSVITDQSASGSLQLDELTPINWSLFLLAEAMTLTDGSVTAEMFSDSNKSGHLKFEADSVFGPQYNYEAYVTLQPSGAVTILNVDDNKFAVLPIDFQFNKDPDTGKYPIFTFPANK